MDSILVVIAALLGATCFAILFRTPRKFLPHTIGVGFLSCIGIYYLQSKISPGGATFAVALGVGSIAHALARFTKRPAQGFLIPAVIFLVPGSYIYRAFSKALEEDMEGAFHLFLIAISVSFAISFGLLLANWIVPSKRTL